MKLSALPLKHQLERAERQNSELRSELRRLLDNTEAELQKKLSVSRALDVLMSAATSDGEILQMVRQRRAAITAAKLAPRTPRVPLRKRP